MKFCGKIFQNLENSIKKWADVSHVNDLERVATFIVARRLLVENQKKIASRVDQRNSLRKKTYSLQFRHTNISKQKKIQPTGFSVSRFEKRLHRTSSGFVD